MEFDLCNRTDLASFDTYLASLSVPIESYLEDALLASEFHRISIDGVEVGAFGIHDGNLLTHFHLVGVARRVGQQAMARILAEFPVTAAYVPTCDEFLLSHVTDREHELKRQGYFFVEGDAAAGPAPGGPDYRPAGPADVDAIREVSGDFLDRLDERVADGEIHLGLDGDDLVAVGVAEPGRLLHGYASIGMFTHEAHRRRGIGTSTIRYLRGVCRAHGVTPIAGCWYYNTNSKLTLEAAGMVTVTRLLRFEFTC